MLRKQLAIVSTMFLAMSACAPIPWHREDGMAGQEAQAQFRVDNARCKEYARTGRGGGFAFGSPAFVASAYGVQAIGDTSNEWRAYRNCMEASGYIEGAL